MTQLDYAVVHAADVTTVFPILTAEAFLEDYARELGASSWKVVVTQAFPSLTTQVDLRAPTHHIPAAFRRFVGDHVDIRERRTWGPSRADGSRPGTLNARAVLGGYNANVRGELMLSPHANAARFTVKAQVEVRLGLLSELAASKTSELLTSVLEGQTAVLNRWLRGVDQS